jgi:predicted NAD/FAD-binding protein
MPRRVAVVGSGVAGLVSAYVLARRAHVTLYEADSRLGGHAHTQDVVVGGREISVDTGFIVHNTRTYPTLLRLFAELGVATQETDMSMSVRVDDVGLEYAGALGLGGIFAQARNVANPHFVRMLGDVRRFHRSARAFLAAGADGGDDHVTVGEFLAAGGYSAYFRDHFMTPVVSAVWSTDAMLAMEYPARYLFTFLDHHGMLSVFGSPSWRTIVGGSRTYVDQVAAHLDEVRLGAAVVSVTEAADGVEVIDGLGGRSVYDAVVVATHPHQALTMLTEPTATQQRLLGAMAYSRNRAQLHTDDTVLPRARRARASWNYLRRPESGPTSSAATGRAGVVVSYDMTRLQRLDTGSDRLVVTLGGDDLVDPSTVLATMDYEHPLYTPESVAAQRLLTDANTSRIAFAGAYHGWGFHEDGAVSGVRAAAHVGVTWDDAPARRRLARTDDLDAVAR